MQILLDDLRQTAGLLDQQGRFGAPRALIELVAVLLQGEEPSVAFVDAEHSEITNSVHWTVLLVVAGRFAAVTARSDSQVSPGQQPRLLEQHAVSWPLLSVQAIAIVEANDRAEDLDNSAQMAVRWSLRMNDGNQFEFPMPLGGYSSAQRDRADALAGYLLSATSWKPSSSS